MSTDLNDHMDGISSQAATRLGGTADTIFTDTPQQLIQPLMQLNSLTNSIPFKVTSIQKISNHA